MSANSDMSPDREYVIGMLSLQPLDARSAMEQRKQHLGKLKDQSASRETYHPTPYSPQQIKTLLKERSRETIQNLNSSDAPEQAETLNTIGRAILFLCLPIVFFSLKSCFHKQDHYQTSYVYRAEDSPIFPKAEPFNPTKHFAPGTKSAPVWTLTQDPRHQDAVKRIFYGKMPYENDVEYSRIVKELKNSQSFCKLIQLMETSLRNRHRSLRLKIFIKKLTVDELEDYLTAEKAFIESIERLSSTQKNETLNLDDPVESLSQPVPEQSTTNP
ncbi:hypothetical protein [Rubinisphaera sp.]|uniref:hypothetical protein n=1 Tax=Rubinisphaera sp. TaxID=2024857 RepID=UPI000C0F692F|nr:hypothetical protein [Rubinisphaera sp.]MBV10800.1 hypothetical protein [Rubinisphaera sp.]HCS55425.1 hypothetical protein [Planctomycetaceae bacterium]|tara:strand:+ start:19941 stop:20756 length:816 start_codon:yes stop_codon:yes gene_type:complete